MRKLNEIKDINYKFTRSILSRAIQKNPFLFYEKYIADGYDSFIRSLKTAWLNTAKGLFEEEIRYNDIDISLEFTHVYDNGDFVIIVSLPYTECGCDLICFYIKDVDSIDSLDDMSEIYENIQIDFYIFYKSNQVDKYVLLEVNNDMELVDNGYISASEELLLKKLYLVNKKKTT